MTAEKKARKKTAWSRSHEVFFLVGDNRIELVPQRTSFEGAKRRDAQMIVSADAGG